MARMRFIMDRWGALEMTNSNKPSILYISHERKMGGANISLFDLAIEMKRRGHRVCVVVLFRGCPIDVRLREAGIDTYPCFFGWWMQPENWNVVLKLAFRFLHWTQCLSVIRLSNYVKKNRYDIIHSNSSVIDIGAQLAKKTGCSHVWHFREFGEQHYHFEYMMGREGAIQFINNNSDQNIFISRALERVFLDIKNRIVIYNGIRDSVFCNGRIDRDNHDDMGFLISGNLSDAKNQMLVLEAVKKIKETGISYKYRIYIAGEATALKESKEYERKLRRYVTENKITNAEFLGYVENMKELRNSKVDVEIVASRSEAYGRVAIEAMASGNLVLASNTGSNPELIGNNKNGMLFMDNDSHDLAEKMMWCMDNPDKMRDIEERAYHYAYVNHRMMNNIQLVEDVYRSLC